MVPVVIARGLLAIGISTAMQATWLGAIGCPVVRSELNPTGKRLGGRIRRRNDGFLPRTFSGIFFNCNTGTCLFGVQHFAE
jgi:hypothetical protein